jgi:ABC-type branched-subunit amino acid transport system substrate-binding protein
MHSRLVNLGDVELGSRACSRSSFVWGVLAAALLGSACSPAAEADTDGIAVGVLLPFTGKEAALGRNLEQALLLAVADVNDAGGVGGQKLRLVTRDSNSGSARGLDQLLQLIYGDKVQYLIGPEETDLANAIVPDIKALNILDILPGYAAPAIEHPGSGAWVRLAPSTSAFACAMGKHVVSFGTHTVNALATADDYNTSLASDFTSQVGGLGGISLPTVSAPVGASSYAEQIGQVMAFGSDVTLLTAPPESASIITTEWTIDGRPGAWYLSPLLRVDGFLENVPFGTLNGAHGLSPSSSLASECTAGDDAALHCTHSNAQAFAAHFAEAWQGDRPFAASNYYYDAVVLLALGLNKGLSEKGELPTPKLLQADIRSLGNPDAEPVRWNDLRGPLTEIRLGTAVGAAAEYEFDRYGAAQHTVFDTWVINNDGFAETGTFEAICPHTF